MRMLHQRLACAAVIVLSIVATVSYAQQIPLPPIAVKRTTGQSIVPVFEGWEHDADGTVNMVFGYMNRNYTEGIVVGIGPNNRFESGDLDRGQPTYFYPRRQQFQFRVKVPKDWGEKELIWTLNVNGQTEKAYGSLKPVWELSRSVLIDNLHGNSNINMAERDQPPTLLIDPVPASLAGPGTVTLTAVVADNDGSPPPPKPRARGLAVGRSDETDVGPPFVNVPLAPVRRFPSGLSAGWLVYRGPAGVAFDPEGYVAVPAGGRLVTKAAFTQPGTYVLRAVASDSMLETIAEVTITVLGSTR